MKDQLLALLPDEPLWLETRGLLRSETSRLLSDVILEPLAFVIADEEGDWGAVVGMPPAEAIADAGELITELLAFPENRRWVEQALGDGWSAEEAILHTRDGPPNAVAHSSARLRFLEPGEVAQFSHLAEELAGELTDAERSGTPIGTAAVDGTPVAFCYAGTLSETLWDVSVDTLEQYRRRGLAGAVFEFMAAHWAKSGRRPAWDALASNAESLGLAAKLGFVPVARHWIFTREDGGYAG